ncbi:hypothetical protein OG203_23820 [Nocardia sp. NBC_01499]|uniref:hypothetical protein n=1 Tax=Nocardia sp. NBC_01499 TaxID=2903597 RepID=UPI00386EF62C
MNDELIYFSQTKAQGLLASNGKLARGLKFEKATLEGSVGVLKASASVQPREYAVQINAAVVKRLEAELFRNGDVVDLDGESADSLKRGAWFKFSRQMAFGAAFADAGPREREPEALYFIDMPDEPPACRLFVDRQAIPPGCRHGIPPVDVPRCERSEPLRGGQLAGRPGRLRGRNEGPSIKT